MFVNRETIWERLGRWFTLENLWWFFGHRTTRYVIAWIATGVTVGLAIYDSSVAFNKPRVRDSAVFAVGAAGFASIDALDDDQKTRSEGHTTIDFGGQWLMGRMLIEGHGRELYHRDKLRAVLSEHYPDSDHDPDGDSSDVENLMRWMMGNDDPEAAVNIGGEANIGGPLYPPINAFLAYPLALYPPKVGYRIGQAVNLLLMFVAGLAVSQFSRGRIWLPVSVFFLINFPGFIGSFNLAQNATLTFTILLWGWVCLDRGRPMACGVIWGLLAFKPVWALSYFLVLLLTRRWRACLAMAATGAALAVLTLPVVGWHSWLHWLQVGQKAAALYKTDHNWICLSRDLLGLGRRWYGDDTWSMERPWPMEIAAADVVGWGLLALAAACTTGLALWRWRENQATQGPRAAFLLLGGWMCCYHFMYYDTLLGALAFSALFADPRRFLEPLLVAFRRVWFWPRLCLLDRNAGAAEALDYYRPQRVAGYPRLPDDKHNVWVVNSLVLYIFLGLYLVKPVWYCVVYGWQVLALAVAVLNVALPVGPLPYFTMDYYFGAPWEQYLLIALWLWCGVRWLLERPPAPSITSLPLVQA